MEPTEKLVQAVKEYREGKVEAFDTLYQESKKYIYTCIYKAMKGNDNLYDIIEDTMQETYIEISRSIGQLKDDNNFLSWASRIARSKYSRYIKKNDKYVLLNEEDDTIENLSDSDNIIPEEIMQNNEKQRLIREIIDTQLTEMQRLCIDAFYYNGLKQSEIAEEFCIPENTVKTHLSRAKAKIQAGVLDVEKRDGIKLHSLAPLLLLFFTEDVEAAVVPEEITQKVLSSVSASISAGTGATSKGIIGKITGASLKTKIIATVATVGVLGGAGVAVYVASQNSEPVENNSVVDETQKNEIQKNETQETDSQKDEIQLSEPWAIEYKDFLLNFSEAVGFDLNDFDGDGIPELLVKEENGNITVHKYENKEIAEVYELVANAEWDTNGLHEEFTCEYGYSISYDEIIELDDWTGIYNDNTYQMPEIVKYVYYNGELLQTDFATVSLTGSAENIEIGYYISADGNMELVSQEDGAEYIQQIEAEFHEITYTSITSKDIDIRLKEFIDSGNRQRIK